MQELSNGLGNSTVLKLESEGYQVSIKRWSEEVEKRAVSHICRDCMPDPANLLTMERVSSCTYNQPKMSQPVSNGIANILSTSLFVAGSTNPALHLPLREDWRLMFLQSCEMLEFTSTSRLCACKEAANGKLLLKPPESMD